MRKNPGLTAVSGEPEDRLIKATHGDSDHPLRIGDVEIPCYVLQDGRRVIVRNGLLTALAMSEGTASAKGKGDRLARFISTKGLMEVVPADLADLINNPIRFSSPGGSQIYYGYEATVLADLCSAILDARDKELLHYQQEHIAVQADILIRAFAKVGIVALVDEVTGYQYDRASDALAEILEKFIGDELAKWVKTFPDEYYRQLFRLRKLPYSQFTTKRPVLIGKLTNDIVYERLAPGIAEELKRKTPKTAGGNNKNKYFQWLTSDVGHPALREHLHAVITLMKASPNWDTFKRLLERSLPKWEDQQQGVLMEVATEDGI